MEDQKIIQGIYLITNKINNQNYVGESKDILARFKEHARRAYDQSRTSYNSKFYRAIRKFGWDSFDKIILEEEQNKEIRLEKEKLYGTLYNALVENGGYTYILGEKGCFMSEDMRLRISKSLTGKRQSLESRNKKSISQLGSKNNQYGKRGILSPNFGVKRSKETLLKMSSCKLGEKNPMYGKPLSDDHKYKIGLSNCGENHWGSKLTSKDVIDIRSLKMSGVTRLEVYNIYSEKISIKCFDNVWYNNSWKHIKIN